MKKLRWIFPFVLLLTLVVVPTASAHDGPTGPSIAGPLAWGLMGFGALVIAGVSGVLFTGNRPGAGQTTTMGIVAADFESLTGFRGYIGKMRLFSRNARLYMVHIVGMDVIYGTWHVIFNLYLLAAGMSVAFVGLRIMLRSISSALAAIPAGVISDRIGRKLSFILGDGMGALMSLIAISTLDPTLLLVTAVIGGLFGGLHGVSEPAFMAENSEDYERVHLFSVSSGLRTAAAIIGSALAGLVPLMVLADDPDRMIATARLIMTYRYVAYFGIAGWFASLIPALMLTPKDALATPKGNHQGLTILFANLKHPGRIWKLTLPEVFVGLGAGFVLPLLNVFFKQELDSPALEIGTTFATGEAFLVVGSFLAPLVAARLGKVNSVVATRMLSIPFILLLGFSPGAGALLGSVLSVAGFAYVMRITLMNMAAPVRSAFSMEILDPGERGTQVGLQHALAGVLGGGAAYLGARMMEAGDYQTPFFLMAGAYLVGTVLFWRFFNGKERELSLAPVAAAVIEA